MYQTVLLRHSTMDFSLFFFIFHQAQFPLFSILFVVKFEWKMLGLHSETENPYENYAKTMKQLCNKELLLLHLFGSYLNVTSRGDGTGCVGEEWLSSQGWKFGSICLIKRANLLKFFEILSKRLVPAIPNFGTFPRSWYWIHKKRQTAQKTQRIFFLHFHHVYRRLCWGCSCLFWGYYYDDYY